MKNKVLLAFALSIFMVIPLSAQKVKVDLDKSTLVWTGKKVTGQHHGTVQLKSGWLKVDNNKISEGAFTIDMTSIVVDDLEGNMKTKLENHLKSDDFFGVDKHNTANIAIIGSDAINSNGFKLKGNLTIKNITHPIEFEAKKVGDKFVASIVVDRSKYNVKFRSAAFFENLGDKLIYDDFRLDVVLHTK